MRSAAKQRRCLTQFKNLRTYECAIDEQGELAGQFIRTGDAQSLGEALQPAAHFALVRGGNPPRRMIVIREFRSHVELRATAVIGAADTFADPFEMGVQFGGSIIAVLAGDAIPNSPEIRVFAFEKRSDQIVLGSEMSV